MNPAENDVSEQRDGSPSPGNVPMSYWAAHLALLTRLCLGLERQAETLDRLVASNEALLDALYQDGDGEGPDTQPTHYLSSKPISQ